MAIRATRVLAVLLLLLGGGALAPWRASAQQPPLEATLLVEPLEPRERLSQPNLEGGEAVLFGLHRGLALLGAPLVEFAVDRGILGGGSGRVEGLKIRPGSLGSGSGIGGSVGYVFYPAPVWGGISAGATIKGYQEHSAFLGVRDARGANFFRGTATYDLDTQDEFSGLGMNEADSPEDGESDYQQEEIRFLADAQAGLSEGIRAGVRGGLRKNTILRGENDDFDDITEDFAGPIPEVGLLPGLPTPGQEDDYAQGGVFLAYDTRNDARNADRGVLLAGSFDAFRGVSDTPFDWNRFAAEFTGYFPIPDETRVIALRVFGVHQETLHDQVLVPFYYLSSLGGSNLLRSFSSFRFQDNDLLYGAAEFRRRVWAQNEGLVALDAALFVESAGVYRDFTEDVEFENMEQSFGTELRILVPNDVVARLGFAVGSREGTKLYLGGGGRF